MAEAAQIAAQVSGADFIDINMGCPVGKVVSNGDGSALMKDPEKAARIAEAVVKASPVPVTVKMRRGWDKGSVNAVELSRMLEQVGVAAIAVHGRTRVQMYGGTGRLDHHPGGEGGGVPCRSSPTATSSPGRTRPRILKVRPGRTWPWSAGGCFGNPWIFQQAAAAAGGGDRCRSGRA